MGLTFSVQFGTERFAVQILEELRGIMPLSKTSSEYWFTSDQQLSDADLRAILDFAKWFNDLRPSVAPAHRAPLSVFGIRVCGWIIGDVGGLPKCKQCGTALLDPSVTTQLVCPKCGEFSIIDVPREDEQDALAPKVYYSRGVRCNFQLQEVAAIFDVTYHEARRYQEKQFADYATRFLSMRPAEAKKAGVSTQYKDDHYLRAILRQDRPDSLPYVYVYWRPIRSAPKNYQIELHFIAALGYIPGELTSQRGHFYGFRKSALSSKRVQWKTVITYD